MKTIGRSLLILAAAGAACFGQQWEFGGMAGAGFLNAVSVSGAAGAATAGFQTGPVFGAYVGFSQYKHIGGELRYAYQQSNLSLKSGGSEASFAGHSQAVHYDLILKTDKSEGKVQLFAALGGGLKVFQGTGKPAAFQNLSQYGYFTQTRELKPMASVGAGVKFALSKKVFLRAEFRDYITAFPEDIITPAPGTKYGTLLHDLVPMIGLGFEM